MFPGASPSSSHLRIFKRTGAPHILCGRFELFACLFAKPNPLQGKFQISMHPDAKETIDTPPFFTHLLLRLGG